MKICIPLIEKDSASAISPSFGRAAAYLFYDTDTQSHIVFSNEAAFAAGGAGIKAAQSLVDNGINVLIAPRCGENAAKVLLSADVALYQNIDASWQQNIKAFEKGELQPLKDIHKGHHNGAN